jgi:hypothetical protein
VRLLSDLVQAMAADADLRDGRHQQEIAALQAELHNLQRQMTQLRLATEKDMAALYAAQFPDTRKGALP